MCCLFQLAKGRFDSGRFPYQHETCPGLCLLLCNDISYSSLVVLHLKIFNVNLFVGVGVGVCLCVNMYYVQNIPFIHR